MRAVRWCVLAAAALGLGGCALAPPQGEAPSRTVTLGGESFTVRQLTEGTWTASTAGLRKVLNASPARTAMLRKVVETASGCTVTDSDYARQQTQFDAQVICAAGRGQ